MGLAVWIINRSMIDWKPLFFQESFMMSINTLGVQVLSSLRGRYGLLIQVPP